MDKAQQYLDYVNIMTYDFYTAGKIAGHHTNLFPSEDYDNERSTDKAVNEFIEAGVPTEKIVVGIAFYGRSWKMKTNDNHGINREVQEVLRGGGYTEIKDSIMHQSGFKKYWDENAKAPYLFNDKENILISYDDEESVKHKCLYVKEKNLGGVMFWEYLRDPQEYLLDTINEVLRKE
jgi:chitinase